MNFDFSDDQKQLRDEARKFLAEKCPPKAVRTVLDGKQPYDRELWKGLADMGFLGVAIPEAFGGAGAGHLELCVIAEEMGRALAPVPVQVRVRRPPVARPAQARGSRPRSTPSVRRPQGQRRAAPRGPGCVEREHASR